MTNQDNLPVWAKILLVIPVEDAVLPIPTDIDEQPNSGNRGVVPSKAAASEQSVFAFGTRSLGRKRRWKPALCPTPCEANS